MSLRQYLLHRRLMFLCMKIYALVGTLLITSTLFMQCAFAQDIFTGTITVEGSRAVLKRCDLGQSEYLLQDQESTDPGLVARFIAEHAKTGGFWYADVIGIYEAFNSRHGLRVIEFQNLQESKSCHLLDAIKELDKPPR